MSAFHERLFCEYGHSCQADTVNYSLGDACPLCGFYVGVTRRIVRWKSTRKWYRPATWGAGYWEGAESLDMLRPSDSTPAAPLPAHHATISDSPVPQ